MGGGVPIAGSMTGSNRAMGCSFFFFCTLSCMMSDGAYCMHGALARHRACLLLPHSQRGCAQLSAILSQANQTTNQRRYSLTTSSILEASVSAKPPSFGITSPATNPPKKQ